MILLVTGGFGFIGASFVNHVMRRHPDWRVCVLDSLTYAGSLERIPNELRSSSRFAFFRGDIRDRRIVEEAVRGAEVVVHYAAESHVTHSLVDGDLFTDVNVRGTGILCEAIVKCPVHKLVLVSSSEVYGNCLRAPMDEDHPLNPRSPYAGSKAAADRLAYSYYEAFDIPLVIVRPFNNYGPFQHTEKVIPSFIRAAVLNEVMEIDDDGLQTRDWLYVEDHSEAMERVIEADIGRVRGQTINVGSGVETNIDTIAEIVVGRVGRPRAMVRNHRRRLGQVRRQVCGAEKAAELLGWTARTSFDKGIEATIQWYLDNESWWRDLPSPGLPA